MVGLKTNTESFVKNNYDKCIAGVVAIPENKMFRIYVAWNWEKKAEQQLFVFSKSREIYKTVTDENIERTANYGIELKDKNEINKIFSWLY